MSDEIIKQEQDLTPPNAGEDTDNNQEKSEPIKESPQPENNLGDNGKKALSEERKARREAEKRLKELESKLSQVDIDKYQQMVEQEAKLEQEKLQREQERLEQEGKFKEAKEQLLNTLETKEKAWLSEKAELLNQVKTLSAQLEEATIGTAFSQALSVNKIVSEVALQDLLNNPSLRSHLKYDSESKQVKLVNPQDGSELLNAEGNPYNSLNEWVENVVKPSRPFLFVKEVPSGSGASNSVAKNVNQSNKTTFTSIEDFAKMRPEDLLNRTK